VLGYIAVAGALLVGVVMIGLAVLAIYAIWAVFIKK